MLIGSGNRGRASSGNLRRFLRAELTAAFYPGMFESPRAAGTAFGAMIFFAGIVVGFYAIQPDQLTAAHGPFFRFMAISALVLGAACVLLRRYFTLLVRSLALCAAAGAITFCVAFADTPAAALSFSTSILFALIVTYVLLPVTHSVYYSLGFAVSISVALSRHDGMLTSDSIVVLASAVAAMLGLHWLVMSALRSETDDLTRLGNRLSFDRLLAIHLREQTPSTGTTVVLIDLDHFSLTNETRQRSYGDQILVTFADRIAEAFPACVGLSRIGGDEFAFLVPDRDATAVQLSLEALRADVHGFSAGIAVRDVGETQSQLTTRASEALSTAKRSGRGTTRVHGGQYASPAAVGLAIANGEFTVVYQPIIDLDTMRAAGVEALLRWTHPTRGAISPEEFIPLCETSGAMPRLGDWVLETAMTTAAGWAVQAPPGHPPFFVSINASGIELGDPQYAARVLAIQSSSGLARGALKIELTESDYVTEFAAVNDNMAELQAAGVPIAIDDFGTGFSNLARLSEVRANVLKIDRRFISAIGLREADAPLVQSILGLARGLGSSVIAEGIETEVQAEWLRAHGCEYGQGFLFSRPVASADVAAACSRIAAGQLAG